MATEGGEFVAEIEAEIAKEGLQSDHENRTYTNQLAEKGSLNAINTQVDTIETRSIDVKGEEKNEDSGISNGQPDVTSSPIQPPDPPHWRTNIALLILAWTLGYTVQCALA